MPGLKTYSDQIIKFIKQSILSGELAPGDKINEVNVASQLSISRAPVREALQTLVKEGLIQSIPQKGKFITTLTSEQIKHSYFTGGILEGATVASTINLFTEKDFGELRVIINKMKKIADRGKYISELAVLDDAFHDILFSKTDNTLIVELSRRSCQGISKFLLFKYWEQLFSPKEIYLRHKKVLDVMQSKKLMKIEQCIRSHYVDSGERMAKFGVDVSR